MDSVLAVRRAGYFAFGALVFALCGWIPGPQGAASGGGASFTGGDVADPIGLPDGSTSAPSLYWTNESGNDTGFYYGGTNGDIRYASNGAFKLQFANSVLATAAGYDVRMNDTSELQFGAAQDSKLSWDTGQTNDSLLWTFNGAAGSNVLILADSGNASADLGLADQADPALVLTSDTAWSGDTTEWAKITCASGGNLQISTGQIAHQILFRPGDSANTVTMTASEVVHGASIDLRLNDDALLILGNDRDVYVQGERTTLTDGVATEVFAYSAMANGDYVNAVIEYGIYCTDATDIQVESGVVELTIVDTAGGVSFDINETAGTSQVATSGTLSSTWSVDNTDDGDVEVTLNANSSLTPSTLEVRWKVVNFTNEAITVP